MPADRPIPVRRGTVQPNGEAIAMRRTAAGLSQEELAGKLDISTRTLQRYESGEARVRVQLLQAVAAHFETPLSELVCVEARERFPSSPQPAGVPTQEPDGVPSGRPAELPRDLPDFVGRGDHIARLCDLLGGKGGAVGIWAVRGMGGVGKTSLAVTVAHRVRAAFPGGRLFIDLKGMSGQPVTTAAAMRRILQAFHPDRIAPDDPDQLLARYRTAVAEAGRVLVVLDNAADAAQVRPLLGSPPAAFLLTSRRGLPLDGVTPVELDPISEQEAVQLMRGIVGANGSDDELTAVVNACGRLPLAVRVAGDFLRFHPDWPVAKYLKALRDERSRFAVLRTGDDPDRDVEAVLRQSVVQLGTDNPDLAVRWAALAALPDRFGSELVAGMWARRRRRKGLLPDPLLVDLELTELRDRSLLLYDAESDEYHFHDLMKAVARRYPRGSEGVQ